MANEAIIWQLPGAQAAAPRSSWTALQSVLTFRRSLTAMFDQALLSGASFATVVLIGRAAGERQLGFYSLAATLAVLAAGVQESLVLIPYTVFAPPLSEQRRRQFAASALSQAGLVCLAMMVCLAVAGATFASTRPHLAPVLLMLSLMLPAALLRDFERRIAFAHLRLDRAVAIDSSVTIVQLALLACLAAWGNLSALSGIAAWGFASGSVAAIALLCWRSQFAFTRDSLRGDWRKSLSLGSWLLAGHVTGISQAYALHWILAAVLGVAATGNFAAMTTLVAVANPLIIGLGNFLMPATASVLATSGAAGVRSLALRASAWLATALSAFCVLAAVAGDHAMTLIYGARFSGYGPAVALLALAVSAAALGVGAEHGLRALDRPRAVLLANLVALIVTLSLAAWLIPHYRIIGAAASLLAGNVIGCLIRWVAFAMALNSYASQHRRSTRENCHAELCHE